MFGNPIAHLNLCPRLTAVLVFLFTVRVHAEPSANVRAATDEVVKIMRQYVHPLDREIMTFHWMQQNELPQISSQAQLIDWTGSMAENFFNTDSISDDMQGVGYYVAIDPRSTRYYGGSEPLLFATPIRKGSAVLDYKARTENERNFDFTAIKNIGDQFRCAESASGFGLYQLSDITPVFRNSKNEACREIITTAFRELGIDAILYVYPADQFVVGCRTRRMAFNIIRREAIAETGNALFWNSGSFANLTFARFVAQSFQEGHAEFSNLYLNLFSPMSFELPKSLANLETFERSGQSWRKRNLFNCGSLSAFEHPQTNDEIETEIIQSAYSDYEIQTAIIDWQRAYREKFNAQEYDITAYQRVLAIEIAGYQNLGLPFDYNRFQAWQKASDMMRDTSDSGSAKDKALGALVGEAVPDQAPAVDAQVPMPFDPHKHYPGVLPHKLKLAGYGPLLRTLRINQSTGFFGGFPILAGQPPDDIDDTGSEFFAANKVKFLGLIRGCTAMMNDPKNSLDNVQRSECAVRPEMDWR